GTTKGLKAHWNGRYRWRYGFRYPGSTHVLNHSFLLKQYRLHRETTPRHSHNRNDLYRCRKGFQYWHPTLSRYCPRLLKRCNFHRATRQQNLLVWRDRLELEEQSQNN